MKKTLERLGAVAAVVAVIAGGLSWVGASPALALEADDSKGQWVSCGGSMANTAELALENAKRDCPNWVDYFPLKSGDHFIGAGHLRTGQNLETSLCEDDEAPINGFCEKIDQDKACPEPGDVFVEPGGCKTPEKWWVEGESVQEPVQVAPPPPPCWSGEAGNNCPVGGALRFVAPKYAMVGVPVTMYAYVSWRPDVNSPAQPTNGTAVIRVDGEDYSGVEFKDGIAEWRFIPGTEGMKEFSASGVVSSGISGANAYIDSVPARTYVLEYDPAVYATALKKKRVEVGDTYVITDPNQARSYMKDRYEWSVSEKSDDVCAVYETKKGAVKAKFTDSGKCTVIWLDKESEEKGKYTFIAKK